MYISQKNRLRSSGHWSNHPPSPPHTFFSHTLPAPTFCFHLKNRALHPQSGAGLTCTLGLQRSPWEDENLAPSLPRKRVTRGLLDPWSRAWSTGSVREAEVKPCGAGAETSPRTESGSPEHRRRFLPLGCWGGEGAGRAGSICCVVISLTPLWLPLGNSSKMIFVEYNIHKIKFTILTIFECPVQPR